MNRERRRFLSLAALASSTLPFSRPALSAEAEPPPSDAVHGQGPASKSAVIQLDARLLAGRNAAAAGPQLSYGETCPVLRLRKGNEVELHVTNGMSEATSVDWHGMRLPNRFEVPLASSEGMLAPGAAAALVLRPPDSGSYWFHPAAMPGLSDQTARGLAGVMVVADPSDPPVDADKVLFLTDGVIGPGPERPSADPGPNAFADVLVNGRSGPETEQFAPSARLRLRIINGSTRRALAVAFRGARPMVVAIDGQPSELFAPLNDSVPMGPGARFDMMVDLPRSADLEFSVSVRGSGPAGNGAPDRPFFVARTEGKPRPDQAPIGPLAPNPTLPTAIPLEHATRANMAVQYRPASKPGAGPGVWTVNGVGGEPLPKKPLFSVRRNTPVTLGFGNRSRELVAFRLHGHVMRLLHALDDGWEPYWRDSVLAPPGVTSHAAFLADNPGRWLIESPFFEQATTGLRTWFEVL